jgi:leucyl aminopeptidase
MFVRDLVNTPAEDMNPETLAEEFCQLANEFKADVKVEVDLLNNNYPAIHAVGRAAHHAPRLLDLKWGDKKHPKVTLVGKGVCFDTGGLDIKPASGMITMKKDMGGAANVMGLARLIMSFNLPICLRVLIPAVENAISSNSYRPSDIINTRKGLSVEIGNTDAEGRVVLSDALAEASNDKPDLLIDFATLTGASRVALGGEMPALFARNHKTAQDLVSVSNCETDFLWHMPLFASYNRFMKSDIADLNNTSSMPLGGAITAALFLQNFVADGIDWLHIDLAAWNYVSMPGRPKGGEAQGVRAVFSYLKERFC